MALIKCPRCDLNYIKDTEKLCPVCQRELKGIHTEEEVELCSICKSAPVMQGHDVCINCYKEMNGTLSDADETEAEPHAEDPDEIDLDAVDPINEEPLPDEIHDEDMDKLDQELSLEQAIEDEENEEDDEDEDEEI